MGIKYSEHLKTEAANAYMLDPDASLVDIAIQYGISATTIERQLAELGYKSLKRHKTENENEILQFLFNKNITNLDQLEEYLIKLEANLISI